MNLARDLKTLMELDLRTPSHGKPDFTNEEKLILENAKLKRRVADLERQLFNANWKLNPDRMGS